jgi:rhamnulokinase
MCPDTSYGDIAYMASKSEYRELFNVNDGRFMAPVSMKEAIRGYFSERGIEEPKCDADYFNCAYHSLAEGYRVSIEELESNVGKSYEDIYIVGGGAKNTYLNGLTEKYTKKRVVALPIEATAIGNLKIQLEMTEGKR